LGGVVTQAAANTDRLLANVAMMLDKESDRISQITGMSKGGFFKTLENWARGQHQTLSQQAGELAGGRTDLPSRTIQTVGGAAFNLPTAAVAAELGGPVLGMAALGGLETADEGWRNALVAAAKGAALGGALHVMGPASRPVRLTGASAMTYAQMRLDGADHATALSNALAMGGMAAIPGGGATAREIAGNIPPIQFTPRLMRANLTPQDAASQAYLESRGVETPLSMQTGSRPAAGLEASIQNVPGGGAFSERMRASREKLTGEVAPAELARIHPEPVTPEEAGTAVGGKLAADLEKTRSELAAQVSPQPATPEGAGAAVINRGRQLIQGLDREANTAYKAAWRAEQDPRNVREIPVLDKAGDAQLDENGKPVTEKMPLPIDMQSVQDALKPVAKRYEYTLSETDARASRGLKAMRQIINGPRYKPISAAELDLGMLKEASRTEKGLAELRDPSQGMAAYSVAKLQSEINDTMRSAAYPGIETGEETPALGHLQAGRKATAKKYDIADTFAGFGRQNIEELEPVGVFRRLTWGGDAGIQHLREMAQLAPDQMPAVGRAFIEGGGNWKELGPETKKILFRDPDVIRGLEQYYRDVAKFGGLTKLEPVTLFDRLTAGGGRRVNMLRDVAKETPEQMPQLGRAFVQGLLDRATREGDIAKVQSTLDKWLNLDPESKALMIKDPGLRNDLNNLMFSLKRLTKNPNPSGSGFIVALNQMKGKIFQGLGLMGGGVLGYGHGVPEAAIGVGTGYLAGAGAEYGANAALARLLFNRRFTKLLTEGIRMDLRGNQAGAKLAARTLARMAGEEPPETGPHGGGFNEKRQ
jgi:hypothetical protein